MGRLKRFFDFYLDASIHVALAVYFLMRITAIAYGIPLGEHLIYFVFFGTIACYNFIKYGVEAEKYILVHNKYHKGIQYFSLIGLLCAVYNAFFLGGASLLVVVFLLLVTGLYALPVLPQTKNLRSFGGLKVFLVALVWAGVTVILPLTEMDIVLRWDHWVEAMQRTILVLILLLPFEIR